MDYHSLISYDDMTAIIIVLMFVVLDIVSGILKAFIEKNICSRKMFEGVMRKCAYILIISLGVLCQWGTVYLPLGFTVPLVIPLCVLIVLTEITSIIENIKDINPELGTNGFLSLFANKNDKDGQ